jgi:hypothetical protein
MDALMRAFWAEIWGHRGYRWTFITVAAFAFVWLCICLTLGWAGDKRWQKVKSRLEAAGESLDYFAQLPPPTPDDQNFFAITPLNGIRDPRSSAKLEAIDKQMAFMSRPIQVAAFFDVWNRAEAPADHELLVALSQKGLPAPGKTPPTLTWREARTEIEKQAPILRELTQAVRSRREAEYLPRLGRHELPEMLVLMSFDHVNACQNLAALCRLYSVVSLKDGDPKTSLDAALVLLRFAKAADGSRSLLGNLVCVAHQSEFAALVWLHLQNRCLGDAELALIQDELRRIDPAAQHLASLRGELALGVDGSDYLGKHPGQRWEILSGIRQLIETSILRDTMPYWLPIAPEGHFTLCKAAAVEVQYDYILQPLKKNGLRHVEPEIARLDALLNKATAWERPDLILVKPSLTNFTMVRRMAVAGANQIIQARLACALERHFLRHGSYPVSLAGIDPEFRAGLDILDDNGVPMHFTLVPGGRFRLWSPGPDGVDDGGKFGSELGISGSRGTTHPGYRGDWGWRYDPAVTATKSAN